MKKLFKSLGVSLVVYISLLICTGGMITAVSPVLIGIVVRIIDSILGTKLLDLVQFGNFLTPTGFWQATILNFIMLAASVYLCFKVAKEKTDN